MQSRESQNVTTRSVLRYVEIQFSHFDIETELQKKKTDISLMSVR